METKDTLSSCSNSEEQQMQLIRDESKESCMVSFQQLHSHLKSRFYLDDEYVDMTRNKFLQYTRLDIPEFRDTLIQNMDYVKKSIGERAQHKREYESRVNERQIQTTEEKTDTSNALDASSVIIESNGTESITFTCLEMSINIDTGV
ncbi:hypothetical protein Tco_1550609 [Tanacetum coccineum]